MRRTRISSRMPGLVPRVGRASRIDIEYFCRSCRGHFSSSVPVGALEQASCRCGSHNLLVYNLSGDMNAPLLATPAGPAILTRQRGRTA